MAQGGAPEGAYIFKVGKYLIFYDEINSADFLNLFVQ